jgi:hypothetical protein
MELASMQVADVVLVSTDTRGFEVATKLANRGWKTVVLELDGGPFNRYLELEDRFGPFVSYSDCALQVEQGQESGSIWLRSAPVALTGSRASIGSVHLSRRYGLDRVWIKALGRSLLSSRLMRRESFLDSHGPPQPAIPWDRKISSVLKVSKIADYRRKKAEAAGVRILDVHQILDVRIQDGRLDRLELLTSGGKVLEERTRSVLWLLSLEESLRSEFVNQRVSVSQFLDQPKLLEPLMGWWRSRLVVSGLRSADEPRSLQIPPAIPAHAVLLGSLERPWTHDNVLVLDLIEVTEKNRVLDVWMRIPYWARADHVYRDEQRLLAREQLADRLPGCEIEWVTPSPISLSEGSIRIPHVLYSHDSVSPRSRLANVCFAGPEVWKGIGLIGLELCEEDWLNELEILRMDWDPAARVQASRFQKAKYKLKSLINSEVSKESGIIQ